MSDDNIYGFSARTADMQLKKLSDYRGKVLLIVNTASRCGFTKQFGGLQDLYQQFQSKGFEVLAFPCNQFANQEPGNEQEISNFCKLNYGVTFQIFEKILVNGAGAHPLFKYLEKEAPGILGTKMIKWNFTKFLINREGKPVERFSPSTIPEKIIPAIKKLL